MDPQSTVTGYVALSLADLEAFEKSGTLRPDIFTCPGVWGKYVPLDATVQEAVDNAILQNTAPCFDVATRDTKWYVLKVSFVGDVIARMFQSGQLHFSAGRHSMEFWSPVEAEWLSSKAPGGPLAELVEVSLPQMSFDDWADRVLSAAEGLQKWTWRATCEQCWESERFLWRAPWVRGGGGRSYCAECWHGHCGGAHWVCESLHEMREWDEWLRTWSPEPEPLEEAETESSEQSWFAPE